MVPIIKTVTHFGYGVSLAALILSVVIFATIKYVYYYIFLFMFIVLSYFW